MIKDGDTGKYYWSAKKVLFFNRYGAAEMENN